MGTNHLEFYLTDRFSTGRSSTFRSGGGAEAEETLCIIIASATRIALCDPVIVTFLQQTNNYMVLVIYAFMVITNQSFHRTGQINFTPLKVICTPPKLDFFQFLPSHNKRRQK